MKPSVGLRNLNGHYDKSNLGKHGSGGERSDHRGRRQPVLPSAGDQDRLLQTEFAADHLPLERVGQLLRRRSQRQAQCECRLVLSRAETRCHAYQGLRGILERREGGKVSFPRGEKLLTAKIAKDLSKASHLKSISFIDGQIYRWPKGFLCVLRDSFATFAVKSSFAFPQSAQKKSGQPGAPEAVL